MPKGSDKKANGKAAPAGKKGATKDTKAAPAKGAAKKTSGKKK